MSFAPKKRLPEIPNDNDTVSLKSLRFLVNGRDFPTLPLTSIIQLMLIVMCLFAMVLFMLGYHRNGMGMRPQRLWHGNCACEECTLARGDEMV